MATTVLSALEPTPRGLWSGGGVRVRRRRGPHRPHAAAGTVCTTRFCAQRHGELLTVEHNLTPDELCDEIAVMIAEQLVDTGSVRGQSEFESVFIGIVRSTVDGGLPAWLRFYRNSLHTLESGDTAFAPIHMWAAGQVQGHRVLDLGSCFGFFPLRLARQGRDVVATDLSDSAMRLLTKVSGHLCRPLTTMTCDAGAVPLPDGSADTVTALHLIEHLRSDVIDTVLDEAVRLARRRVIVAVPFEDEPRVCYGHIQRFDPRRLQTMAARLERRHPGIAARSYEFHGGWLILDR